MKISKIQKIQKFKFISMISKRLIEMGRIEAETFIQVYTNFEKTEENYNYLDNYNYGEQIIELVRTLSEQTIIEMYTDLFPEESKKDIQEYPNVEELDLGRKDLVLFLSHSHKDVDMVMKIKEQLEKTSWIYCFVAHKDIEPTKKWLEEINKYLRGCHAFVPFLSENFKKSNWCEQEVGFAESRNIPVIPIKINVNPYGFIQEYQALSLEKGDSYVDLAEKIESVILNKDSILSSIAQEKMKQGLDNLKRGFLYSTNKTVAKTILGQLLSFKKGQIPESYIAEINERWRQNHKIKEIENINSFMEKFSGKYILKKDKINRLIENKPMQ